MHFAALFGILVVATALVLHSKNGSLDWCGEKPVGSKCSGCPPKYNNTLCASTTRYNGYVWGNGSCGCTAPWTKHKFTAAANDMFMNPRGFCLKYCEEMCGRCYRLCTTGGSHTKSPNTEGECIVIQLENACPRIDENGDPNPPCEQDMTPKQCKKDPTKCSKDLRESGADYPVHFDLQNAHGQICKIGPEGDYCDERTPEEGLMWNNPEVTYEEVDCFDNNEKRSLGQWVRNDWMDCREWIDWVGGFRVCGKEHSPEVYNHEKSPLCT